MKARLGDVRRIIREEYLRGVPEFALRQATTKYVEEIRQQIKRYIITVKHTPAEQREAFAVANEVLEALEEKANDLLEDQLWSFVRNV